MNIYYNRIKDKIDSKVYRRVIFNENTTKAISYGGIW